jgi:hypothetical protein
MNSPAALVSLALALAIGISSALPVRRQADGVAVNMLLSLHTAQFVQLHEDGNVTAVTSQASKVGKFSYRPKDGKIVEFQYNGSFLHFAQVNTSSLNDTALINGTELYYANETANGNDTISNDTVSLVLLVGEIDPESGNIHHYQWKEEIVVDNSGVHYTYSVMLEDGKICYLAFEQDGKPVENPCLEKEELNTKAHFVLYPAF